MAERDSNVRRASNRGHSNLASPAGLFASLCAVICACKVYVLHHSLGSLDFSPLYLVSAAAVSSYAELLIAAAICVGLVLLQRLKAPQLVRRLSRGALYGALAVMIAVNLLNAELLTTLGLPLTIPLIQYSEVFYSDHGREALWSSRGRQFALLVLAVMVCAAAAYGAVRLLAKLVGDRTTAATLATGLAIFTIGGVTTRPAPDIQSESGTLALLRTIPIAAEELANPRAPVSSPFPVAGKEEGLKMPTSPIRNVVLVVLEGVGADYLELYRGPQGVTPSLRARRADMVVVRSAYAQSTSSTMALLTLLSARNPPPASRGLPENAAKLPLFPKYLAKAGMRTGFFHSSDTRFGGAHELLNASGFQTISDYRARPCSERLLKDRYSSLGQRDACTFEQLTKWIEQRPTQPFFAVVWTFETHYPYFGRALGEAAEGVRRVPPRKVDDLARYLGAIAEADRLIDRLIRHLEATGLYDETLLIVTSDHGQSFGQHGTFGNGGSVYEESAHIPLLLINPHLGSARSFDRLTGQTDIGPTILQLLGHPVPDGLDGTSLFTSRPAMPVYFLNYTADRVIGYRIGNRKVISNFARGSLEMYDLSKDPLETNNLAQGITAAEAQRHKSWIAQWASRTSRSWTRP